MKKKFILVSLLSSVLYFAQYDGFEYTGALSSNGWITHGGTAGQAVTLTTPSDLSGSLNYPGIVTPRGNRALITSAQSEDLNLAFSQPVTTTAYASFLLKVTDISTMTVNTQTTAPGYIMHFSRFSGDDLGSTGLVSRLSFRKGSTANTFNIGILNTTGGSAGMTDLYGSVTPTEYQVGTTYFVVLKYDMTGSTGQTSIWINPTVDSEANPTHSSSFGSSTKLGEVSSLALRQSNNAGSVEVDEIRLGTSWQEVVGAAFLATTELNASKKALISNTLVKEGFTLLTDKQANIQIYSASGNLIMNGNYQAKSKVNLSDLSKGIYILKVTEEGKISTIKIVKQ